MLYGIIGMIFINRHSTILKVSSKGIFGKGFLMLNETSFLVPRNLNGRKSNFYGIFGIAIRKVYDYINHFLERFLLVAAI